MALMSLCHRLIALAAKIGPAGHLPVIVTRKRHTFVPERPIRRSVINEKLNSANQNVANLRAGDLEHNLLVVVNYLEYNSS